MSTISRNILFAKLNPSLYKAVENAFTYCRFRENSYVEMVHWLHVLLQSDDNDLHSICQYFVIDKELMKKDVLVAIEQLPTGATSVADISQHIEQAVEQTWTYASLLFDNHSIRGSHLMYALVKSAELSNVLFNISHEFRKIKPDTLYDHGNEMIKNSHETVQTESQSTSNVDSHATSNANASALVKYGSNLTEMARNGEIDPIVGREHEIRQIIDILTRRRQNNPVLTGEAGVGKTAVVEALALRLASGEVPPSLQNVELVLLDIGALKAGAGVSGEFESRLKAVMSEVESSPTPIVLFIDEIHSLIGAGGQAGTADAANLLKPALARGKLRTIGATTWAEYKKYFEKDPALTRRFQMIQVHEPEEGEAVEMLRALLPSLEKHHQVIMLDEALVASVHLSHRYIPARQLPDKAIGLLDTACARVALSQYSTPSSIENLKRKITSLESEQHNLEREITLEYNQQIRVDEIQSELEQLTQQRNQESERWEEENQLVKRLLAIRTQLINWKDDDNNHEVDDEIGEIVKVDDNAITNENAIADDCLSADESSPSNESNTANENIKNTDTDTVETVDTTVKNTEQMTVEELKSEQSQLIEQLKDIQDDNPLVMPLVDSHAIADVVSDWTGIPVGKMMKDELQAILSLSEALNKRVIAQEHGIEAIAKRIQTSTANLDDPNKPIGVFMLAGPSGVGKTETALALADALYGGEHNVITINMSEYQEAHTVSTLKGAPPGYVGYGEGGVLTEAVRRKPYSVVLLDEVEKAHSDVHEIFFQVFDKGWMEDGEGRYIDFKNTIIILTTNVGTDLIMDMCHKKSADLAEVQQALRDPLLSVFPAALLGRIQAIPYYPLSDDTIVKIVELQLTRIVKRIKKNHGIILDYGDDMLTFIASKCQEVESGGRMIDSILTNTVLPEISQNILSGIIEGKEVTKITISIENNSLCYAYEC